MSIGGALAEARGEAGLTITQVSERTRIRATIIRDIERDDYSACGGDYYARGHIRAIAKVVGIDPVPLIEEYDAARFPPPQPAAAGHTGPDRVTAEGGITAAEAFRPGLPMDFERRRPRRAGLFGLAALVLVGVVIYLLVSRGSSPARAPAPPRSHHSAAAAAHRASARPASRAGGPALSSTTTPAPARPLAITNAAAFGPAGTSQGDDPQDAALAIDGSPATAWHSDWYTTAQLGGLQSGTGLLLSLGRAATITSATVVLGRTPGGRIELRAGDTPALADLPVVASTANPGGTLTMRLSVPVQARYVLIWFTSLPPDGAGTYEAFVYDVRLTGAA